MIFVLLSIWLIIRIEYCCIVIVLQINSIKLEKQKEIYFVINSSTLHSKIIIFFINHIKTKNTKSIFILFHAWDRITLPPYGRKSLFAFYVRQYFCRYPAVLYKLCARILLYFSELESSPTHRMILNDF